MGAGCDPGTIGDLVDELADKDTGFILLQEVRGRPQRTTWYHGHFIIWLQGYSNDDERDTWWTVIAIHNSIFGKITHAGRNTLAVRTPSSMQRIHGAGGNYTSLTMQPARRRSSST